MIVFDAERRVSGKCDLCGGDPECVKQCPASGNGALGYVVDPPASGKKATARAGGEGAPPTKQTGGREG